MCEEVSLTTAQWIPIAELGNLLIPMTQDVYSHTQSMQSPFLSRCRGALALVHKIPLIEQDLIILHLLEFFLFSALPSLHYESRITQSLAEISQKSPFRCLHNFLSHISVTIHKQLHKIKSSRLKKLRPLNGLSETSPVRQPLRLPRLP